MEIKGSPYYCRHFGHYIAPQRDYILRKLQSDRIHLEFKGGHTFRI